MLKSVFNYIFKMLLRIYEKLLDSLGPQEWWPVKHGLNPPEWEIMVGAVLTQNTSWKNVEKAIGNLARAGITDKESLLGLPEDELAELIKPSGYYRQKARKLRIIAGFEGEYSRENLLSLWGVGKETADSILLYARNKAYFVVDGYTKRVFSRIGLIDEKSGYEQVRCFFEERLPRNPRIYKEFHALIVTMAKDHCRPKPLCKGCPMERFCDYR
jgi:endonuclease-3 related protein